jgi:alpha-L-rhamnosidase
MQRSTAPDWPAITHETKPWTRWWWMGSAVDRAGLSADLESLKMVGLGGVEITPIYGVGGTESQFVPFLSEDWVRLLEHTLSEAERLDLGVDMATGTGWPFGGPWVGERDACRTLAYKTWTLEAGRRLDEPVRLDQAPFVRAIGNQIYEVLEVAPGERAPQGIRDQPLSRPDAKRIQIGDLKEPVEANPDLQALALEQVRYPKPLPLVALVAYSRDGKAIDLTLHVNAKGMLDWTPPSGTWTLYAVFLGWHGKLVERAAPGGEGNVIDHFSTSAIRNYLARFDQAFKGHPLSGLRAFFNDSYEVDDASGQSDGTQALFEEFERKRGYDLRQHLPELFGKSAGASAGAARFMAAGATETSARILADYRLTISDLLLDTFTTGWRTWAKARGAIVRNQAHGSPANLLDLYAASDIPETEGTEIQRATWATSAAHVAGRRLVSAEAATWLGEHFRSTLADVRAAVDRFFVAGVNHIVYHGTAYSPPDDRWPGWLFYASVEFNSRNSWWQDFGALNQYVTRVQSFLQDGTTDQDVLVYYPFYDAVAGQGKERLEHFGGANPPADGSAFESATATLQKRGYTYDFISDRQVVAAREVNRTIATDGGTYKTLVLPASRFIPLETFDHVLTLAQQGATVIAFKGLPDDVSGLADVERRRARLRERRDTIRFGPADANGVSEAPIGRGRILRGDDLERLLAKAAVQREALVDRDLQFARRRYDGGRYYFIANSTDRDIDGWVRLDDRRRAAVVFDPMTGNRGDAQVRRSSDGTIDVLLSMPRGGSLIVATTDTPAGRPYPAYTALAATSNRAIPAATGRIEVTGPWTVRFVEGGPERPAERKVDHLASWTTFGEEDVKQFSGTATYSTTPPKLSGDAVAWELDLGRVCESARVRLNGKDLGTLIGPTFRVTIDRASLADRNVLEVSVSNLMANRIATLDKAGVRWRKFYNVNFPARLPQNRGPDGLFSAATWEPLDSGLLGPVTLTALTRR